MSDAPVAPEAEEGVEVGVDERLGYLEAQVGYLDQQLAAGKVTAANTTGALATADKGMETILKVGTRCSCRITDGSQDHATKAGNGHWGNKARWIRPTTRLMN